MRSGRQLVTRHLVADEVIVVEAGDGHVVLGDIEPADHSVKC